MRASTLLSEQAGPPRAGLLSGSSRACILLWHLLSSPGTVGCLHRRRRLCSQTWRRSVVFLYPGVGCSLAESLGSGAKGAALGCQLGSLQY